MNTEHAPPQDEYLISIISDLINTFPNARQARRGRGCAQRVSGTFLSMSYHVHCIALDIRFANVAPPFFLLEPSNSTPELGEFGGTRDVLFKFKEDEQNTF